MSTAATNPMLGLAVCCSSRRGASHIRSSAPCQDAYLVQQGEADGAPYFCAAVSDGHGDPSHDQSHIGARLAVRYACEIFADLMQAAVLTDGEWNSIFALRLIDAWAEGTRRHHDDAEVPGEYRPRRYGATLIAVALWQNQIHWAKLGDGDLVGLHSQQEFVSLETEHSHSHLVGGDTYSLASLKPDLIQTGSTPLKNLSALFLCTDGLRNCYSDDAPFHRVLGAIDQNVRQAGPLPMSMALPAHLDSFSLKGSGDDITVVSIHLIQPPSARTEETAETQPPSETTPTSVPAQPPDEPV
jgi:serine/threonine protein phosphatase PrpC